MSWRASFHESAELELNDAADYYDLESPGLGTAFLNDIERALAHVLGHPEAAPAVSGAVRKRVLARFPYSLLYSVHEDEVRILAVAHQKRRPFYWRGRA